jgi:hypothetical protein
VDDQLRINGSELVCPRRQAMIEALEKSRKAWEQGATAPCMDVGSRLEPRPEGAAIVCSQSKMNKETEQASRAMAVMLDRVRKHFAGRMGGDGSCGTSSPTTQEVQPTELSHDTNLPFQGVASNVGWSDNMDQLRASDTAPNSEYHQSAQHLPPMNETLATTNQTIADMDFSAIGDMIDGPMPMDWDIWDDQIMQQNTQQTSTWDNNADSGSAQTAQAGTFDMFQNGSGVIAGNAIVHNGTAPITARETSDLQFDWQDMQDVDLDIRDYATGGLWGASPQWQT